MGYGMKGTIAIGLALSVCLGLLVGALLLPSMNRTSHSLILWNDYVRAAPLVEQSDRIVLAEYLDSTTHEIPEVSPVDGVAHRSVTEEYRRFRVSDSLKGSAEADEVVYAVWTAGYTEGIGSDETTEFFAYETVALETGQEYVLFMHSLPVAPGYPTKYGDVVWTIVGEPGVAVVGSEGRLSFKASERYKNGVDNAGHERPVGSAAPFELTKAELIELIGGGGGGVVATGADSG